MEHQSAALDNVKCASGSRRAWSTTACSTTREIEKVRTVNMGTEYEISWLVRLREPEKTKEFLDALRVRNGNLNVCLLMSGSDHDTI